MEERSPVTDVVEAPAMEAKESEFADEEVGEYDTDLYGLLMMLFELKGIADKPDVQVRVLDRIIHHFSGVSVAKFIDEELARESVSKEIDAAK